MLSEQEKRSHTVKQRHSSASKDEGVLNWVSDSCLILSSILIPYNVHNHNKYIHREKLLIGNRNADKECMWDTCIQPLGTHWGRVSFIFPPVQCFEHQIEFEITLETLNNILPQEHIVLMKYNCITVVFFNNGLYPCKAATSGNKSTCPKTKIHFGDLVYQLCLCQFWKNTLSHSCSQCFSLSCCHLLASRVFYT